MGFTWTSHWIFVISGLAPFLDLFLMSTTMFLLQEMLGPWTNRATIDLETNLGVATLPASAPPPPTLFGTLSVTLRLELLTDK